MDIEGLALELEIGSKSYYGTDDHLYLGVVSRKGGREFALAADAFNDFEARNKANYFIGKRYHVDLPGRDLTPATNEIILEGGSLIDTEVSQVYLRKQSTPPSLNSQGGDDALQITSARIWIFADDTPTQIYALRGPVNLMVEIGLTVWFDINSSAL